MKREDLIAMGISEENVAKIMADYGSAVQKANAKSEQYKADAERVAELEKQLEKVNKQNMTDIELANAERDKALSSVANLEKQIEQMITKTELAKLGITGEVADTLVSGNGKLDFATLGQIISDREKNAVSEYEKKALENTPNPSGSKGKEEPQKTQAEQIAETLGKVASATSKTSESIIDSYKS